MDSVIGAIIHEMQMMSIVDEKNIEVYRFGLECMLLKIIHIISYIAIGLCVGELPSLLVSAVAIIPLRRKAGGYHAPTRTRCYIFSCGAVWLLCMLNKMALPVAIEMVGALIADVIIIRNAPIENPNRSMDKDETNRFRKSALQYLAIVNAMVVAGLLENRLAFVATWAGNGLILVGVLMELELLKLKKKGGI